MKATSLVGRTSKVAYGFPRSDKVYDAEGNRDAEKAPQSSTEVQPALFHGHAVRLTEHNCFRHQKAR